MFDKTRVYTALNADELPIGSRCYFADNLSHLKDRVLENNHSFTDILKTIANEDQQARFEGFSSMWPLAYLVEPPEEVVKPFETIEEVREAIVMYGGFLKNKNTGYIHLITGYSSNDVDPEIFIQGEWHSLEYIAQNYVFDDDGSPCGSVEGQQK